MLRTCKIYTTLAGILGPLVLFCNTFILIHEKQVYRVEKNITFFILKLNLREKFGWIDGRILQFASRIFFIVF